VPTRAQTTLQTEPLDPIGVRVTGVDLTDPATDLVVLADALRELLAEHGVAVLPGQPVDDPTFQRFLESFGDLTFTRGETPVEGFPDLNVISNVGRTTPPRSSFHVDTSYVSSPPAYTALRTVEVPAQGGATQFTNQYRAYETLPADLRDRLDGRTITHVVTGVEDTADQETSADHPVFRPHPVTGRVSLYLTTPPRCAAISGLDEAEGREVVEQLFAHSTDPANTLDHAWAQDDVVIWDNSCVLHRADHSGVVGDRVMHRGMVAAYR